MEDKKIKVLFIHNSLPEYRLKWFEEMSKIAHMTFLITNSEVAKNIYVTDGTKYLSKDLVVKYIDKRNKIADQINSIFKESFDFVELPPIDSWNEFYISSIVIKITHKKRIKTGYFWEKWEAPSDLQPISRRIKNFILGSFAKNVYKKCDVIFSSGSKNKEYFQNNGVSAKKIVVIPDSVIMDNKNIIDLREKYEIGINKKIVLYFGRIIRQKGLDLLIEAVKDLSAEYRNRIVVLVAGDGEFRGKCENLVNEFKLDNVIFAGRIEPDQRYDYYSQSDIFVHPGTFYKGRTDVWGLTLNESMQVGNVIIATEAVGSAYDLIENGENGFFIKAGDSRSITLALQKVLEDESIFYRANNKNRLLMKHYNPQNMAKIYIDACESIVTTQG